MADDRPRITRVALRNYRSIESCDVALSDLTLSDLTLLVGPNGSGKSNFLDAITFLRGEAIASIPDAVRRRGGMRDVSFQGCGEFSIGLTIEGNGRVLRYELEIDTAASGGPSVRTTSLTEQGGASPLIVFARDRETGGGEHHSEDPFFPESGYPAGPHTWQLVEWRVFDRMNTRYRPKEHQPAFSSRVDPDLAFPRSRSFRRLCNAVEALAGGTT